MMGSAILAFLGHGLHVQVSDSPDSQLYVVVSLVYADSLSRP